MSDVPANGLPGGLLEKGALSKNEAVLAGARSWKAALVTGQAVTQRFIMDMETAADLVCESTY